MKIEQAQALLKEFFPGAEQRTGETSLLSVTANSQVLIGGVPLWSVWIGTSLISGTRNVIPGKIDVSLRGPAIGMLDPNSFAGLARIDDSIESVRMLLGEIQEKVIRECSRIILKEIGM